MSSPQQSKAPAISVIMAVYNAAPYLPESIGSILNQTFSDFEFIIINDCSTDNSPGVILASGDPRIVLIDNTTNIGQSASQNKALDVARGEYIALMDADDISLPTRFEKQLAFLKTHNDIDACGVQVQYFGERNDMVDNLPTSTSEVMAGLAFSCCFSTQAGLYRKSFFEQPRIRYTEGLVNGQDYELVVRGAQHHGMAALDECLFHYRIHPHQVTKADNKAAKVAAEHNLVYLQGKLGLQLNDTQKKIYISMRAEEKHNGDLIHLEQSADFIKLLLSVNSEKQVFSSDSFSQRLGLLWFRYLKPCTRHGLACWKALKKSGLAPIVPTDKRRKFFMRCLLGKFVSFK